MRVTLFTILYLLSSMLIADENCNFVKSGKIDYATGKPQQTIRLIVSGNECKNASVSFSISTETPRAIYFQQKVQLPFLFKFDVDFESKDVKKQVEYYSNNLFTEITKLAKLPKYSESQDCGVSYVVSEKYYNFLKSRNLPVIYVPNHYEGGHYFTFVPELNQSIKVAYEGC